MNNQADTFPDFAAAGQRMWELVEQYTNQIGYRRGTKAPGLDASPPVIDCSGWVGVVVHRLSWSFNTAPMIVA